MLAVGAGPANLALAVAIEESGHPELAANTLLIEQHPDIKWQRGLLLPAVRSQVSFIKDLVTLRNPRSDFSFLNFMHSQRRLDEFVNLATFYPYRSEISDYLAWVADSLRHVRVRYDARCASIAVNRDANGSPHDWTVTLSGGDTITCRDLVIGVGREPNVPEAFRQLPADRVIHSSRYRAGVAGLARDRPYRVAVVGGAQSAAEMFYAVHEDLPACRPTILLRSVGFQNYQTSKFVNELFFPSFIDEFYGCDQESRRQILDEMRITNYAGLAPPFLDELYALLYRQRLNGGDRSQVMALTEIVTARQDGDQIVLELSDRRTKKITEMRCDLVLLGTGYRNEPSRLFRQLEPQLGTDRIGVSRHYRAEIDDAPWGAIYLQGTNEETHGIADSLISVLAHRSAEIVDDMLARRTASGKRVTASVTADRSA
ncbi:SidA/IucD/PvdA family monooxygenase [Micromonospora sp. CPCC 205561]|uniref:SidA/IucD/PvdA family monooxygenase n=1 Tax=Micromonospora sp. CPCC 205561 TaxID=3122407 RepID=UPI002FF12D0D